MQPQTCDPFASMSLVTMMTDGHTIPRYDCVFDGMSLCGRIQNLPSLVVLQAGPISYSVL